MHIENKEKKCPEQNKRNTEDEVCLLCTHLITMDSKEQSIRTTPPGPELNKESCVL